MEYRNAFTEDQLSTVAKELLRYFPNTKVFLFFGNLGSGKTTLIKHLCQALGVKDHVSSPTYGLVNTYESAENGRVYHFDLYRLKDESEALDIGIESYLDENAYCFVEWPKLIVPFVPETHVQVRMQIVDAHRSIHAQTAYV